MAFEANLAGLGQRHHARLAAERERAFRRAARHSRLVRILRRVLPVIAVLVLAAYFVSTRMNVTVGDVTASIDGMVPEGYVGFKGKINEEIEVTFDQPGFYGIKCSPHFGMGMVMLVKVGEAELKETIRTFEVPARARPRFDAIFARIDAGEGK